MTPLQTSALIASAAVLWLTAVLYSRRRWPHLGCRVCGGTGKAFEPLLFRVLCLRWRRRAWRRCGACGGTSAEDRPRGLAIRS